MMNMRYVSIGIISALLSVALAAGARADLGGPSNPIAPAAPLAQNGSAFTYQGHLRKGGAPVNASCNASFSLFDAEMGGAQVGGTVISATLQVANGLFTIPLDFGWNFNGEGRWLETAMGCGETPTTLAPRTALRPAPYAFALPGMRTVPGNNDGGGNPTMNVIGGVVNGVISNTIGASSFSSAIAGGQSNRIDNGSFQSAIGGGDSNRIDNYSFRSAIGGGSSNRIDYSSNLSAIGSGFNNRIDDGSYQSAIGGGASNRIDNGSGSSAIGGGSTNIISGTSTVSAIGGGASNRIDNGSLSSAIGGGANNRIDNGSGASAIGGGAFNVITSALYAAIPGGANNRVEGDYGFAAGLRAKALHNGAFVWGDSTAADIASTVPNQFIVRASGGVTMFTNAAANTGASLFSGSGSWTSMSDRNLKANTAAVDPRAVLDAIAALPVSTWNYSAQDASIRHIGPMAQDFYAAFNVGETDTGISAVDAQGVAFAAIQGLYQVIQERDQRITQLEQEVAQVKKGANPDPGVNLFNLVSLLALGGVIVVGLRQRRGGRS